VYKGKAGGELYSRFKISIRNQVKLLVNYIPCVFIFQEKSYAFHWCIQTSF